MAKIMENTTTKATLQKPEMIDMDIELTDKKFKPPAESLDNLGPSPS